MNNLREIRKARGKTLAELAEEMGLDTRTVQRFETGERNISLKHLESLAKVLNCEITDLILPTAGGWKGEHESTPKALLVALIKSLADGETDKVIERAIKVLDAFYNDMPQVKKDSSDALTDAAKMALLSAKHSLKDIG